MESKKQRKTSSSDSKLKTTAKRGTNYKDKFKYGLEYETLVYSPRIKTLYETEKQRLNTEQFAITYKCDLTKDTFNSKSDKEKTAPYRRFVQESIQERATAENASDVNIRYEFRSSCVKCPVISEDKPEWIITHDSSVQSNPPPPRELPWGCGSRSPFRR
jgi:heterodisulfide reductase subunit B